SGSHSLSFRNNNEEIQISHKSLNRKVYSEGAFIAARWLLGQGPGLYEISDIYLSKTP
ncbi:MAG: 4-hydroxy-tetrahydrodipicolinate reductase, partial [Gammaproteobacteria bacterium]|nr:4-hydroxy-tetrahydrodipicolinate reductase [Gammaproteobacteria bacterium]